MTLDFIELGLDIPSSCRMLDIWKQGRGKLRLASLYVTVVGFHLGRNCHKLYGVPRRNMTCWLLFHSQQQDLEVIRVEKRTRNLFFLLLYYSYHTFPWIIPPLKSPRELELSLSNIKFRVWKPKPVLHPTTEIGGYSHSRIFIQLARPQNYPISSWSDIKQ